MQPTPQPQAQELVPSCTSCDFQATPNIPNRPGVQAFLGTIAATFCPKCRAPMDLKPHRPARHLRLVTLSSP